MATASVNLDFTARTALPKIALTTAMATATVSSKITLTELSRLLSVSATQAMDRIPCTPTARTPAPHESANLGALERIANSECVLTIAMPTEATANVTPRHLLVPAKKGGVEFLANSNHVQISATTTGRATMVFATAKTTGLELRAKYLLRNVQIAAVGTAHAFTENVTATTGGQGKTAMHLQQSTPKRSSLCTQA